MGISQSSAPPSEFVGKWKWREDVSLIEYEIGADGKMNYFFKDKTNETTISGYGVSGWSESATVDSEVKGTVCCCCSIQLKIRLEGDDLIIWDMSKPNDAPKKFNKLTLL